MPLHFHIYYKARFSTPLSQQTSTGAGITLPSGWIIDTPPSNIDLSTGKELVHQLTLLNINVIVAQRKLMEKI